MSKINELNTNQASKQPVFYIVIGILLITIPSLAGLGIWIRNNHAYSRLTEVVGYLDKYYIFETKDRHPSYEVVIVMTNGDKYWSKSVGKDLAPTVFGQKGEKIRVFKSRDTGMPKLDGAVRSYGLWVDDREISSISADINKDRLDIVIVAMISMVCGGILLTKNIKRLRQAGNTCREGVAYKH